MAINANAQGVVTGKFTIPNGVQAGSKQVLMRGSGGSTAEAVFVGEGTLVTNILQKVTRVTTQRYDPLAQTFTLTEDRQIGGIDLFVTAVGSTPITVQIRETQVGFPNQTILAEAVLQPNQISVGNWNRFVFHDALRALANVEYAIVVMCTDATGAVAIAELGKWDASNNQWVTQQPYTVGVMLSSSNASTWTAHQDRDLAFRLLARSYTQARKEVSLGTVNVADATDLLVYPMADNPVTGADSELTLTLPDGSNIAATDGQVVRFPSSVTGPVQVKAVLRSTEKASAVLHPGTQIVSGSAAITADYVSRAIQADAAGSTVRVIFDANVPSGATVTVHMKGPDVGDTWQAVPMEGQANPVGDNFYEYQHVAENVMLSSVQIKLTLTGTAAARPFVSNLRVSVT